MTVATPASSSSSPRLPSPPPLTEVQFGPRSPGLGGDGGGSGGGVVATVKGQVELAGANHDGATRRIRPGTTSEEMNSGPPLVPLNEVCLRYRSITYIWLNMDEY